MRSSLPKVLHRIAGRSLIAHALENVVSAGANRVAVVVGPGRDDVTAEAKAVAPDVAVFVQHERKGTAHAVLAARDALGVSADDVIIAYADTPLVTPQAFSRLRAPLAEGAAVVVLGFHAADPAGYGRLLMEGAELAAIREHKDATEEERGVTLCNAGLMALRGDIALHLLEQVGNANSKGEYYLTDVVEIARAQGARAAVVTVPENEVHGVNDRAQLAVAERMMQDRLRAAALESGVTMHAPETVFLSYDTALGRDVIIEPHVVFGPGVVVEEGAVIHSFSHLEGAHIQKDAGVGPFARLRPGTVLGPNAKVGNFVEVKNAQLGPGVKAGHLSYLGDATVGAGTNIGAGTITCNYDGFSKFRTVIGAGAFIGSNTSLVAPVNVGDGGFTASGSVITQDVPADALGLGRARQVVKEGWAKSFRDAHPPRSK
jgi:bifunctional UDP-N-acetylglucosamine pyrophosphorylase/glucosamine-1-phosphate N-acetyltransferase